jgi:hypothetical protein
MWLLDPGWEDALGSRGAQDMEHLAKLIAAVPWWQLEPDHNHELVVAGRGEFRGLDLCTVARTPDRTLAVAYLPSLRPITLDLQAMAGPRVRLEWFNPVTGARTPGGSFATSGQVDVMPPGCHDWALIVTTEEVR